MNCGSITSDKIFEKTRKVVAPLPCQEEYLRQLATIVSFHIHRNHLMDEGYLADDLPQVSALVVAPTGQGKTYLLRKMAETVGLNLITIDCSTPSAEGWKGMGLSQRLLAAQKEIKDHKVFAQSILFFDEIDKLHLWGTAHDQGNAMNNILQLYNSGRVVAEESGSKSVHIDIKRFTVLLGGAFEGLDKIISKRLFPKNEIGFGRGDDQIQTTPAERLQQVTKADLVAYGMLPELLGRIGTILTIPPLTRKDYRQLLLGDKGSIQYQYQNYLRGLYGVSFALTEAAANCIAEICLSSGSGTRAVAPVVNEKMREAISEVERNANINQVLLEADERGLCVRYDYGTRVYCYSSSNEENMLIHRIKGKNCTALVKRLCRYYRKAGGELSFLPTLELFLECALVYLYEDSTDDDFCFASLEKLARTVQRVRNGSKFEQITCIKKQEIFRQFRQAYTMGTQRDLVIALQKIMEYLERYHKKVNIQFVLKNQKLKGGK